MLKNYLISAWRNIQKQKFYALLNLLGLSLGLTAAIFIMLYLNDELQYDTHHSKHELIYRVNSHFKIGDMDDRFAIAAVPIGPSFKLEFPEVAEMTRLTPAEDLLLRPANRDYYERHIFFADSTVFDIFSHDFIYGNPKNALNEINSIVLTESLSRKFFGDQNPVGELIESGLNKSLKVTAVINDLPLNSHMRYEGLISMLTISEGNNADFNSFEPEAFWNIGVYTFVLLHQNSSTETLEQKFPSFYDKYMKSLGDQINASFLPDLMPLAKIHLHSDYEADFATGNMAYIYIFGAVGLFLLLLAAINYMNMATARSMKRAREVGIRKVSGAQRKQLVGQFIAESFFMVFMAALMATVLVNLLLPDFNQLSNKSIPYSALLQPGLLFGLLIILVFTGLLSGSYPAMFLSSFKPITVLRGSLTNSGKKSNLLRRILVVIQFTIATILMIGTFVVHEQLQFLKEKELGFERENRLVLQLQDTTFRNKLEPFKAALLQNPAISSISNANGIPGQTSMKVVMQLESETGWNTQAVMMTLTDYDYLNTFGIKLIKGRDFDRNMGSDKQEAAIVNEAFIKQFGWTDDPLGKKVLIGADANGEGGRPLKVVGVVADYHFQSLHNPIEPYLITLSENPRHLLTISFQNSKSAEVIDFVNQQWDLFASGKPFDYKLLNQILAENYTAESRINLIFSIATLFTIFIALLGLLGLTSYVAEQKTKEIGIRKILGASPLNLFRKLFQELGILIGIAFLLAVPLAFWRIQIWLENSFAYHITIQAESFILAGLIAFGAGLLTMSFHLIRVISNNPVEAIKYE